MLKEKLLELYNAYGDEEELLEYRMTPLRKFVKMIGMDPTKMSSKQMDRVSKSARYKQWLSTKRILKKASDANKKNPNLKENLEERHMTDVDKKKEKKLKKKYDDSEMYDNMVKKYGEEKGEQIYFAYIRKKAMKEDVLDENRYAGWNAKKLHRYLLDNGFEYQGGSKHFSYVHSKSGRKIKPIPNHKGDIPVGTVKGILTSVDNIVNGVNEDINYQPKDYEVNKGIKPVNNNLKIYKRQQKGINTNATNLLPTHTLKSELVNKGFDVHTTTNITTKGMKKGFRATPKEKIKATKGGEHYLIRMKQSGTAFKGQTAQRLKGLYQKEDVEETKVDKLLKKAKEIKIRKTLTGKSGNETDTIQVNPKLSDNRKE